MNNRDENNKNSGELLWQFLTDLISFGIKGAICVILSFFNKD